MTSETFSPLIQTQRDLESAWRHLMQPLGFRTTSLWLMMIGADDRPLPHLVEVEGDDGPPDPALADGLAHTLRDLLGDTEPGSRWALLRSRPGRSAPTERDRVFAESVYAAARAAGVPLEVIHLASDEDIVPLPADEVTGYVQAS